MPPKEVKLEPRRQPPKAQELQNAQAMIEAKAQASKAAAQNAPAPDIVQGEFKDVAVEFEGVAPAVPSQKELEERALAMVEQQAQAAAVAPQIQTAPGQPHQTVVLAPKVGPTPKAPASIAELKAQHARPNSERFPDVADIFQGKVPNERPLNGPIEVPKPQPVKPVRQEVVITHQIQDPNTALICLKSCDVYVRDAFVHFEKDSIVTDFSHVDAIRQSDNPNFAPYGDLDSFETCPHCHNRFPGKSSVVKYG